MLEDRRAGGRCGRQNKIQSNYEQTPRFLIPTRIKEHGN
jgi:hypothetical protein